MRNIPAIRPRALLLCCAMLLAAASALCQSQATGQIGALQMTAVIEPYMSVALLTVPMSEAPVENGSGRKLPDIPAESGSAVFESALEFSALEKPGLVDADKYVVIVVSSNCTDWNVTCTSQGLTSSDDFIPSERIFVRSDYTDVDEDRGAGVGYEGLGSPKLVAAGSLAQDEIHNAFFKLDVTWEDAPGSYDGVLTFTVLPTP
jgi:hypothetical protein